MILYNGQEVNNPMTKKEQPQEPAIVSEGVRRYQQWRDEQMADPEFRAIYEEEAAKSELWLQLVEARQEAGLTQDQMALRLGVSQAQVARIEKRGYDTYTLTTLRKYVAALGEGFSLEVRIHTPQKEQPEIELRRHL
jgi:DNA-binding XRE family transcriptional regulator